MQQGPDGVLRGVVPALTLAGVQVLLLVAIVPIRVIVVERERRLLFESLCADAPQRPSERWRDLRVSRGVSEPVDWLFASRTTLRLPARGAWGFGGLGSFPVV